MFQEYINHGWALCRIQPGEKGPRSKGWNIKENAVKFAGSAELKAAGLMHAYSGTCAFDIDDLTRTLAIVPEVADWFLDPSMVRIDSGRPNRAKFLFALPEPLPSKTFGDGAFELRCSTSTGRTAQDVLPPSPHPSGTTYKWVGDWKQLPTLPSELKAIWYGNLEGHLATLTKADKAPASELEQLVMKRDPSCGYDDWIRIGMVINHETEGSEDGFELWDRWSNTSDKYPGIENLRSHWQSFGRAANPTTIDSLRRTDVATAAEFDFMAPEAPQPNPFRFLDLPELFGRSEPDWLIPDVLPRQGLGSFWGQPGSGKTFLAVDLAVAVALGSHWRGLPIKNAGKVLYIAAEDDSGVQVRFASALAARGQNDVPVRVLPASPTFTSPKQSEALLEAIKAEGPQAAVFVDTLAAVTPGADENSSKDIGPFIAFCHKIQKVTGAIVILIHHSRKDGDSLRGSSSLHAAFDVEWKVTEEDTYREVYISKMKNAEARKSYAFHLKPVGKSCIVTWI